MHPDYGVDGRATKTDSGRNLGDFSTAIRLSSRSSRLAIGLALFAAAVVLPLFRQTGSRSWQTIWAEDGFVYFEQARRNGGLAVLLRGYDGYVQLPPRLLAVPSTYIPIHHLSTYLALSATFVGALLAWFTYHFSNGWVDSRPVRLALASLVVLMPVLGVENTANITNTIWVFVAVAPWALVSSAEGRLDVAVRGTVAFLAATSTGLVFLFLPLALGFALLRRTRATWIVTAIFSAGLVVQGGVVMHTKYIPSITSEALLVLKRSIPNITHATGEHVFVPFLLGTKGTSTPWLTSHDLLIIASVICFALIFGVLLVGVDHGRQVLAVVFVLYALVIFITPAWSRQQAPPRYSVIPVVLLASAVAVLAAPPVRLRSAWISRVARPLFVVQVAVVTVLGFSVTNLRSESPQWSASVSRTYTTECITASPNKLVQVQTDFYGFFWPVTLPCRDLA